MIFINYLILGVLLVETLPLYEKIVEVLMVGLEAIKSKFSVFINKNNLIIQKQDVKPQPVLIQGFQIEEEEGVPPYEE